MTGIPVADEVGAEFSAIRFRKSPQRFVVFMIREREGTGANGTGADNDDGALSALLDREGQGASGGAQAGGSGSAATDGGACGSGDSDSPRKSVSELRDRYKGDEPSDAPAAPPARAPRPSYAHRRRVVVCAVFYPHVCPVGETTISVGSRCKSVYVLSTVQHGDRHRPRAGAGAARAGRARRGPCVLRRRRSRHATHFCCQLAAITKHNHTTTQPHADKCVFLVLHDGELDWALLCGALPPDDCRFAVFDLAFTSHDGRVSDKLVLILWAPSSASARAKMLYAASKSALTSLLKVMSCDAMPCHVMPCHMMPCHVVSYNEHGAI